jgi:hypothetical protein
MAEIHIKDIEGKQTPYNVLDETDLAKIAAIQELTFAIRMLKLRLNK